jgi:hypothetical protein
MTDMQYLSRSVDGAQAQYTDVVRPSAPRPQAPVDRSLLADLPPHKEWRRNRYLRARRRGLWKEQV